MIGGGVGGLLVGGLSPARQLCACMLRSGQLAGRAQHACQPGGWLAAVLCREARGVVPSRAHVVHREKWLSACCAYFVYTRTTLWQLGTPKLLLLKYTKGFDLIGK